MKNCISRIAIMATLIFSYTISNAGEKYNIYIENHYGATIKFKKGDANSNAPEVPVANQERVFVGESYTTPTLSIRTTGAGSRFVSYFTELTAQLNQIYNERLANRGKDAIIIIKPSRSYQNWDIEIHWERPNQTITAMSNADEKLARIMNGLFGEDYAQKARAINNYDYTKATQKGLQNLRTHLLKRIEETIAQTYEQYAGRKANQLWTAPNLSTDDDLRDNINMLYRSLQRYKSMGY